MSGSPTTSVDRIYTRRNEAPPCSPVKAGNFQILPNPTDDPSVAANMPRREANRSREVSAIISSDKIRACPRKAAVKRRPVNITPNGIEARNSAISSLFQSNRPVIREAGTTDSPRSSLSSAVRFYSVLCYGKNTPPKTSRLMQTRQRSPHASSHIPARSFRAFFQGRSAGLSTSAKPTSTPREFVPGSRLIPALDHRQTPSEGRRRPGQAHRLLLPFGQPFPPTLPICWSASPATCRPIVLTAASPAGRRRGFPWSISPQPSLCSVRFRSRPVPWCSSASSAVPSGIRSSGCPPLSARGWSSPGFPGSAASACCFRTCRGTGVEPVIRKIKNSGAPRQRYPVRRLACVGEPFQRDRLFQPTRLLTGASFHREKLSTRHTNGWGTGQKGAAQARSPSGSPPHAAVPRDLAQTHQAVRTLFWGTGGLVIL